MAYFISIQDTDGKCHHHKVPREVYVYVRQLENGIRSPEIAEKIKEAYPYRFNKEPNLAPIEKYGDSFLVIPQVDE